MAGGEGESSGLVVSIQVGCACLPGALMAGEHGLGALLSRRCGDEARMTTCKAWQVSRIKGIARSYMFLQEIIFEWKVLMASDRFLRNRFPCQCSEGTAYSNKLQVHHWDGDSRSF